MVREHEIAIRVRYAETDAMGLLHHSNYFVYFEMGRTELLRANGGDYRLMEDRGLFMVVTKVECKFRRPARYDDMLRLNTKVVRTTAAKVIHQYLLFHDELLLTEAQTTLACVDREGKVQLIPPEFHLEAELEN